MDATISAPILLNCYPVSNKERVLWKLETTEGILFVYDNLFRNALKESGIEINRDEPGKGLRGVALKNEIHRHRIGDRIPESKTEKFRTDGFHINIPLMLDLNSIQDKDLFDYHAHFETFKSKNLALIRSVYKNPETGNYCWIETSLGSFSMADKWFDEYFTPCKMEGISKLLRNQLLINMLVVNEIFSHQEGDLFPNNSNQKFKKHGFHIHGPLQVIGELNWKRFNDLEQYHKACEELAKIKDELSKIENMTREELLKYLRNIDQ